MWQIYERLKPITLDPNATLSQAMTANNVTGSGVTFFLNPDGRLVGILTDGDLRRAFLSSAALDDRCSAWFNRTFVAGRIDAPRSDNLALMSEKIFHLPLLDAEGRLIDFITWKDMWHVPLVTPSLSGNELSYVQDCIATGWVSSQGAYIGKFETAVGEFLTARHALSTANGTLALQLALQALDIGPGDEVIVPNFTFGASANAVMQRGAKPIFADVDPETWTLDPAATEALLTPRTKAIMPVHIYGHPCDMDPLMDIARRHQLRVVEDCAEALGAAYKGRPVGTIGDIGCFSFFANKIITTGEGGMVTTNDPALADRLKVIRDHGMRPERRYWHVEAGTNCRMTNLQAAVGLAQMERIATFLDWRDGLASRYDAGLEDIPGIRRHVGQSWARKVCWLYTIAVDPQVYGMDRDALLAHLKTRGIEGRPVFAPLHIQPAYPGCGTGAYPVSERLGAHGLSLPTGNDTPLIEVMRVVQAIRELAAPA
ncbi:MAG: aminotransferase class I/II-fold pyridoxal phosphate-dependent enzyme [Magnetospirillum sp.]|nr:aminotransferase class I/II-fold pyridoxal phosphate-dependent enzyme [Magnetospirillum sp.]